MTFNVQTKSLDLGNLQATAYKHNKTTYLPQDSEPTEVESSHQTRRTELRRVFESMLKSKEGLNDKNVPNAESNLSADEYKGVKSLQK